MKSINIDSIYSFQIIKIIFMYAVWTAMVCLYAKAIQQLGSNTCLYFSLFQKDIYIRLLIGEVLHNVRKKLNLTVIPAEIQREIQIHYKF
jgi:hypothetical protein